VAFLVAMLHFDEPEFSKKIALAQLSTLAYLNNGLL